MRTTIAMRRFLKQPGYTVGKLTIVLAALLCVGCAGTTSSATSPKEQNSNTDEVVFVASDDPDMATAIQNAQASLNDFLKLSRAPEPGMSGFKLKVMIRDGEDTEHFWVTPFQQGKSNFEGGVRIDTRSG